MGRHDSAENAGGEGRKASTGGYGAGVADYAFEELRSSTEERTTCRLLIAKKATCEHALLYSGRCCRHCCQHWWFVLLERCRHYRHLLPHRQAASSEVPSGNLMTREACLFMTAHCRTHSLLSKSQARSRLHGMCRQFARCDSIMCKEPSSNPCCWHITLIWSHVT